MHNFQCSCWAFHLSWSIKSQLKKKWLGINTQTLYTVMIWFSACLGLPQGRATIWDRVLILFLRNKRMFKTKLEDEIICLKELCTHMEIIVDKAQMKACFWNVALSMGTMKSDEALLMCTLMVLWYFIRKGALIRMGALIGIGVLIN